MRAVLVLMLALATLPVPATSPAEPSPPAPDWSGEDGEKVMGLMEVWGTVEHVFPHVERLRVVGWDQAVQDCVPRVLAADGVESYYRVLMELVARLGDSHTMVLPPWGHLKPGYDIAPVELRVIDGRFYVDRVGDRPSLVAAGVVPGAEVVSVDGVPTATRFAESVLRYRSWGAAHASAAGLAVYLLYGPAGGANRLEVRADGASRVVEVPRDAMSGDPPFMTRQLENAFAGPTIRSRVLPGGIQYVEIPNFEHDQACTDFQALIDAIDPGSTSGMILDLRFNMGGSNSISEPMVACLIDAPVATPTMKYRLYSGAREAWGHKVQWDTSAGEVAPREGKRYLGPLIVLVGHLTNSSAEDFALELRAAGRARLVGQRTAGGAGNALTRPLPGGGTLRVATFTALTQDGEEYVGVGIAPDEEVAVTPEDLAADRDPALERALALLGQR